MGFSHIQKAGAREGGGMREFKMMKDIDSGSEIHPRGILLIRKALPLIFSFNLNDFHTCSELGQTAQGRQLMPPGQGK